MRADAIDVLAGRYPPAAPWLTDLGWQHLVAVHRLDHFDLGESTELVGSALATGPTGPSTDQLRATIETAVDHLGNQPKGDQLRAVLCRTYVRAAPTQEAAAEVLDLPLSTYRLYLAKALDQLADILWAVEIGGLRLPAKPRGH